MGTCIWGSPNRPPCCPPWPLSAGSQAWMRSSLCPTVFYLAKTWECRPKLKGLRTNYGTISSTGHWAHLSHVTSLSFDSTITVTAGWTLLCLRVSDPWNSCLINHLSSPAPCIPSPSAFVLPVVMKVWELRCPRCGRSFRILNLSAAPVILHSLQEFCKPLKHVLESRKRLVSSLYHRLIPPTWENTPGRGWGRVGWSAWMGKLGWKSQRSCEWWLDDNSFLSVGSSFPRAASGAALYSFQP